MVGETVTVFTREPLGEDEFGEPSYGWVAESVGNVLVRPLVGSELKDADRPDGVRVSVTLAMPKAWTSTKPAGHLAHARVALTDRGMSGDVADVDDALRVSGYPDRTIPSPLAWDPYVEAGRVDG